MSSVLGKLAGDDSKAQRQDSATGSDSSLALSTGDTDDDARELIEVYFDLEAPSERDTLLARLTAIKLPVVTEFLRVMMSEDEDEYVRATAAAELARRGVEDGIAQLESDLEDPDEIFFFENAARTLAEVRGPAFYETMKAFWDNRDSDGDSRM